MATETLTTTTTTFEEQKIYVTRATIQLKVKPEDYVWHTEVASPIKVENDAPIEEELITPTKKQTTQEASRDSSHNGIMAGAAAGAVAGLAAAGAAATAVNASSQKQQQQQRFIPVLFKEITKKNLVPIVTNFMEAERYHTEYNKWLTQAFNDAQNNQIDSTNI